jgi:hypothetical protein
MNNPAVRRFSEAKQRKRRGPIALWLDPLGGGSEMRSLLLAPKLLPLLRDQILMESAEAGRKGTGD